MSKIHRHAIFTTVICYSKGAIFTTERQSEPYAGFFQLPESPVRRSETLEQAAHRTLFEASGLNATKLNLVSVFDDVASGERRIPNIRSFIVSFVATQWTGEIPLEGCRWMSDWRSEQLAWEHNEMLVEADSVLQTALMSRQLYAVR